MVNKVCRKRTGADELCYANVADTNDVEGKLKVQFWRVASELFVESWVYGMVGQFNILLNTPPAYFRFTIMYREELPQVLARYKLEQSKTDFPMLKSLLLAEMKSFISA